MTLQFTKQDAITFLIGLGVALGFVLGGALVQAETLQDDWGKWAARLGVGLLTATGRYLVTYLLEKGFKPSGPDDPVKRPLTQRRRSK